MPYVTIDIEITPSTTGSNSYKVDANIKVPGGPKAFPHDRIASEEISINLEEWKDLNDALESLKALSKRSNYYEEETQVKEFGKSLFRQVIKDGVYTLYKNGKEYANRRGHVLRLRLHLESPVLIQLPWELLCEERIFSWAYYRTTSYIDYALSNRYQSYKNCDASFTFTDYAHHSRSKGPLC